MKHYSYIPVRSLQLFADGGQGSGGAAQGTGVTAPAAGVQQGVKGNPASDAGKGVQVQGGAPAAGVQQATEQPDRNAEFERLIKGQYKDLYDARVSETVQKRVKGSKETVDKYNAISPVLPLLAQKYGVDAADTAALVKAIENDSALYEKKALESGMTVETYMQFERMRQQNEAFQAQEAERSRREQEARQNELWAQQAQEAKQLYPQLDLQTEIQNPQFKRLLDAGVDVGSAYLVLHQGELIPAAMQQVAQDVEQRLANKIAAGSSRPAENGMQPHGGTVVKNDVSTMTKKDRAEINRRVLAGERISFS